MAAKKNTRKKGATRNRKAASPRKVPVWVWLLFFVAVIAFVAFLWHVTHRSPAPVAAAPAENTMADIAKPKEAPAANKNKGKQPAPAAPKVERNFDFYEILPNQKVLPGKKSDLPDAPIPVVRFYLQAGAFIQEAEADKKRAEMLLLGLQAQSQVGKGKDGKTLYRVIIGPYANQEDAKAALSNLKASGVETILIQQ